MGVGGGGWKGRLLNCTRNGAQEASAAHEEEAVQSEPDRFLFFREARSEDQLQRELDIARRAGADAGRSVPDVERLRHLADAAAADGVVRRSEIARVEQVKDFEAELGIEALGDACVFEDREIDLVGRWSGEFVASLIGVRTRRRQAKGIRIEPVRVTALYVGRHVFEWVAEYFGAVLILFRAAGIGARVDGKGRTRVEREQRVELPAAEEELQVRRRGSFVAQESGERVADVEIRVAVVTAQIVTVLRNHAACGRKIVARV